MRQLSSVVRVLGIIMDRFRYQLSMRDIVAPQFIRYDLPWLSTMATQQAPEKTLRRPAVSTRLQKYIDNFAVLVDRSPKIMLLTIDFDENLINEESIAVPVVIALQSPGIFRTELYGPKADRFAAHRNSSLSQQILNVPVAEIESKINPNGIADDSWRKSMALVRIHSLF